MKGLLTVSVVVAVAVAVVVGGKLFVIVTYIEVESATLVMQSSSN